MLTLFVGKKSHVHTSIKSDTFKHKQCLGAYTDICGAFLYRGVCFLVVTYFIGFFVTVIVSS